MSYGWGSRLQVLVRPGGSGAGWRGRWMAGHRASKGRGGASTTPRRTWTGGLWRRVRCDRRAVIRPPHGAGDVAAFRPWKPAELPRGAGVERPPAPTGSTVSASNGRGCAGGIRRTGRPGRAALRTTRPRTGAESGTERATSRQAPGTGAAPRLVEAPPARAPPRRSPAALLAGDAGRGAPPRLQAARRIGSLAAGIGGRTPCSIAGARSRWRRRC